MASAARPDPRWNPRPRPFRRGHTMHELFGRCASRAPHAVAMVDGERRISYTQLDVASDIFAARLEEAGVGHGDLVPLILPKSPELVVAMLSVLKRGAAYAALDPHWPADRTMAMVEELAAPLVVTSQAGPWPVPVVAPPGDPRRAPAQGYPRPTPVEVREDDVCSVFFTSGTSGAPKAVLSLHRGTVRLFDDCTWSDFGPGSAMIQTAAAAWDGFTFDCWGSLLCGGKVVFADSPLLPGTLRRLITAEGVSHAFLTTSLFNMLVDEGVDAFDGLAKVMVGGEKLSTPHLLRFIDRHPGVTLANVYGPVECTVIVTEHPITRENCLTPDGPPLGRPLANTEIHVLDGSRVCAVGEQGEICLGGDGLARGYLDPGLTARKFTEVVIDGTARRVYRSGDLGYWSSDGLLHFAGRVDRQVKIRGHRIEVEEIETRALTVPHLADASVIPVTAPDGSCVALALFYTSHRTPPLERDSLRGQLAARLPDYMVPTQVHRLDRLPLTSHGKLDHRALTELAGRLRAEEAEDDPTREPATETERRVAAAFSAVLRRDSVPLEVSFFDLGGSSLDAARLCARLSGDSPGAQSAQLYRTPDVRSFAAWLAAEEARDAEDAQDAREAQTAHAAADATDSGFPDGRVPLTSMQDVFLIRDEISTVAWRVDGEPDLPALREAVRDVHRRHQALHARYQFRDGLPMAVLPEDPGEPAFHELPPAPECEAAAVLGAALREPLSISEGHIWRTTVIRHAEGGSLLVGMAIHHIAFDGWSQALLADALSVAYAARLRGRPPVFAQPPVPLAEANAEHHRYLARVDLDRQREFWTRTLHGLPELVLPDQRNSWEPAGPVAVHRIGLSRDQVERVERSAGPAGGTRFVRWFSAMVETLRLLTGQLDVGICVPVASRGGRLMDAVVTTRVDVVCLRATPEGESPELSADQAERIVGQALANQEIPFRSMVMHAAQVQDMGALLTLPMFILQDNSSPVARFPGCRTRQVVMDEREHAYRLVVEVEPLADGGAGITVTVRTDMVPAALAERVGSEYVRALFRRSTAQRGGHHEELALAGSDTAG